MIKDVKMQDFFFSAYKYSCYALCIIDIAEEIIGRKLDIVDSLLSGIENGYICFNFDNYKDEDNFFVRKPHLFLGMLTNKKFDVRMEKANYEPKNNEYMCEFYSANNGASGHFTRLKQRNFNSLCYSNSVNKGVIISTRVFREV